MFKPITYLCILLSSVTVLNASNKHPAKSPSKQWEKTIQNFEEWDYKNSFPSNAVLFVGSSSIRLWHTSKCFPEIKVINRGFGGSQISDVNYFANRIVLPYKPKVIVLYAGDNDIAAGKSPQHVFEDFRAFAWLVHKSRPKTHIIFISIKPSLSRWAFWPRAKEANLKVKEFSEKDIRLTFVDISTVLLGHDAKPDTRLYLKDNLHLNSKGYKAWTKLLKPIIAKVLKSN
ncbi:MAG: SGNH/GDSL hydrolase family protein [Planctomycetota bacterium]|jgi:lysophospholipase L1-like esterase